MKYILKAIRSLKKDSYSRKRERTEQYLALSQNLSDLENRIRRIERGEVNF